VTGRGKVQVLEADDLPPTLRAFPDDPSQGGVDGHYAIAPVDAMGSIDQARLSEWASRRESPEPDPLVESVRQSILEERKWP
jgi:hypothetical protein